MRLQKANNRSFGRKRAGFTLVEVLTSVTVFSIVISTVFSFFIFGMNLANVDRGKLLLNQDIRRVTSSLAEKAMFANGFVLYDSFTDRTKRTEGLSGDFLALIFTDENDSDKTRRIIGYYRAVDNPAEAGPVQTFTLDFTPPSDESISSLLPAVGTLGDHQEVIGISRGLSNGRLFYNLSNRSIMLSGEILQEGSVSEHAASTYNFTISPRG